MRARPHRGSPRRGARRSGAWRRVARWRPRSRGRRRRATRDRSRPRRVRGAPRRRQRRACRARPPLRTDRSIADRPASTRSGDPSTNVTLAPARAATSTMPEPMSPQPTTPTRRTSAGSTVRPLPSGCRRSAYNPCHVRPSREPGGRPGRRGRGRAAGPLAHLPPGQPARPRARDPPRPDRPCVPRPRERRGDRVRRHGPRGGLPHASHPPRPDRRRRTLVPPTRLLPGWLRSSRWRSWSVSPRARRSRI